MMEFVITSIRGTALILSKNEPYEMKQKAVYCEGLCFQAWICFSGVTRHLVGPDWTIHGGTLICPAGEYRRRRS